MLVRVTAKRIRDVCSSVSPIREMGYVGQRIAKASQPRAKLPPSRLACNLMLPLDPAAFPRVPPALLLMLREFNPDRSWAETRRRIRTALRDMKEQSFAFESQNVLRSYSASPYHFDVHAHGALDLLSGHGCIDFKCRIAAADRLARSLGLIADHVWLTDYLSSEVLDVGRATNASLDRLMMHAVVLGRLLPLIRADVIRFRSPWMPTCAACSAEFEQHVETVATKVLRSFRGQISVERTDPSGFFIRTGSLFEPPLFLHSEIDQESHPYPTSREAAELLVTREVREVLWTAREAAITNGVVFSNSRLALAGLLQCDGRLPKTLTQLRAFEDSRYVDVPWVSELNAAQILQLREEASAAMPVFRETLAQVASVEGADRSPDAASRVVAELRAQAMEVRAELMTKQAKSARYWKVAYGVLGFGLSAYGVATDQILPAVGGMLPILQLLIAHKTGHEAEVAKLKSRPAYVLVKAQDILAHAD
jgi:hypothetical protein